MKTTKKNKTPRNETAMVMILSGKGRKQIFRAKQDRRKNDARNSWQKDNGV